MRRQPRPHRQKVSEARSLPSCVTRKLAPPFWQSSLLAIKRHTNFIFDILSSVSGLPGAIGWELTAAKLPSSTPDRIVIYLHCCKTVVI